ncbi:MAG: hypothetical protein HY687_04435 [Chloroflexi bacterium]|nr:hypothetical protein [Chloroflexota bacterium]
MNVPKTIVNRRSILVAATAGLFGWLLSPAERAAAAQKATLLARPVTRVPEDPEDSLWASSDSLDVPLAPQAVVKPRTYEAGVKALTARALYDETKLAFLLEWGDAKREVSIGRVGSFRDAIAVEFPGDPSKGIPYFGMGESNKPVTIYQWKADWQFAPLYDVNEEFPNMAWDLYPFSGRAAGEMAEATDYGKEGGDRAFLPSWWAGSPLGNPVLQAKTPVEKLTAEGFGTLTSAGVDQQNGTGKGVWKDGAWRTVISFPKSQEGFVFERGKTFPVAFAAWDGARQERGGEKAVSTWYFLSLEQPLGPLAYISPVLAVIGAAAIQVIGLGLLRRRARQTDQVST